MMIFHAACVSHILRRTIGMARHYRMRIEFLFQNILERYAFIVCFVMTSTEVWIMKRSRKFYAYALAGSMLLGSGGLAVAQSTPTTADPVATSSARNDTGNRGDERRFDWGG
jgi:hypothetical protein